jgi:hypothetical protein
MNKVARKPSLDPIQEKLRQSKSQWNKDVSVFITDLINLKKTMNGWPSKFHMERSFIKDPIPADPHSILGVLASDFQELAQQGNSIIQQQLDYSKTRRKRQPKQPAAPVAPSAPSAPDLTQQLSAANLDYNLIAEGSNPVTRFFSRLKGPWFGESPEVRMRKYRLSMLRACALLEKDLEKFEATIVGSTGESIFIASKLLHQVENHLRFVLESLASLKALESGTPIQPTEEVKFDNHIDAEVDKANKVITDFHKNYANFNDLDGALVKQFSSLILKFLSDDSVKESLAPDILNVYKLLLTDINNKRGASADSLSDLLSRSKTAELQVVAQNILDKWVGKINHNINPFDKTSALRLDAANLAKECIELIDGLMNSLEKGLDADQIKSFLAEIHNKMIMIKSTMRPLEATIQGKLFDKTFIDLLQDNKLSDYESKLDKKQKEQLEKMIQTKQFRDLTNMYSKKR